MQRESSTGSRITWFVIAAIILGSTWVIGLRLLPAFRDVFASFGAKLPIGSQVVFTFGPAVLVSVGLIAAVLLVMGEFTPALRGVRPPLILLVVILIGSSFAAIVFIPPFTCGEVIDLSAQVSSSPAQLTNAPLIGGTAEVLSPE